MVAEEKDKKERRDMEKKVHKQDLLTNLRHFLSMYMNINTNTFNLNMFKTKLRTSAHPKLIFLLVLFLQ